MKSSIELGAESARDELVRMDGVLFVRVEFIEQGEDGALAFSGGSRDPSFVDMMNRLHDVARCAIELRRKTKGDADIRLAEAGIRIHVEKWPNMISVVAIQAGHPSTKSLKRKLRRVAKKFDPEVKSPGASASPVHSTEHSAPVVH